MIILFLFLLLSSTVSASIRDAMSDYHAQRYQQAEEKLRFLQVDKPYDGLINYNLGVVQYKQNKFEDAKESFDRAEKSFKKNKVLQKEATFNLGNSYYKNTLTLLGKDWENKKLDETVLNKAIEEIKGSIGKYDSILKRNPDVKAQTNKKIVEELLKKLEQKKQQQKDDKQQDQKDNKNQDQKDDKQQDKQDKKDQEKDKEQSKDNKNKEKQDKQDQRQDKKDQEENKEQPPENKDEEKQEEQEKKPEEQKKEVGKPEGEVRAMNALLANIQSEEEKKQKALIKQLVAANMQKQKPNQKNW